MSEAPQPWYRQQGWVLLLLLFVPPVGIALLWSGKPFTQGARVGLTIASSLLFIGAIGSSRNRQGTGGGGPDTPPPPTPPSPVQRPEVREPAPAPRPPPVEESPIVVPVGELLDGYKSNEIRSDAVYKGKLIQTTGIVGEVTKVLGRIYVTVGTGAILEVPTVQCFFEKDQEQTLMELSKGNTVTVKGRVEGLMMNVSVRVKKCVVVP